MLSDYVPCYAARMIVTGKCTDKAIMRKRINKHIKELSLDNGKKSGILCVSITEQDAGHIQWLDVLSKYKGVGCTSTKSNHGEYMCYFITIPVAENV